MESGCPGRGGPPRRSVSSGCAAGRGRAGRAARFPSRKGGHHFPGIFGFADGTGRLQLFVAGPEQDLKFISAFLALEFVDRHRAFSIFFLVQQFRQSAVKCQEKSNRNTFDKPF